MAYKSLLVGFSGLCLSGFVFFGGCAAAQDVAATPPNIVMIVTDDLGWGDLGVYGNRQIQTPNLDRLAGEGRLFTQFYVTSPVCSPSRASFLTGKFAPETGIHFAIGGPGGDRYNSVPWLDDKAETIYDVFKAAGYNTAHFGKWHLGSQTEEGTAPPPEAYGIDVSATSNSTGRRLVYQGQQMAEDTLGKSDTVPEFSSLPRNLSTEAIVSRGIEFIEEKKGAPFFMSLWTLEPHSILNPTDEQMEPYLQLTHPLVQGRFWSSQTVYYSSITNIDTQVGVLMDYLEDQDLRENTIIIFTSDNGPSPLWSLATGHAGAGSSGPFRGVKGSLYEGGIRVPLIVSWPEGLENGVDTTTIMSAVDMLPTLIRLTGRENIKVDDELDGEDFSAAVKGDAQPPRSKPLFWDYRMGNWGRDIQRSPRLAMRDGDWKLLMNPDGSRIELYNLEDDKTETSNVAAYEIDRVETMQSTLMEWFETEVPDVENAPSFAGRSAWQGPE